MRATLTFKLPEESLEHQQALNAGSVLCGLQTFDNYLRSKLKYEALTDEQYALYQEVREKLHDCMKENEVSVWE